MVKIQAGHYYDTGYMICKAEAIADKPGQFFLGCHCIDESGRIVTGEQIAKREVYVSQVAPVPATTPAPGKWVLDNGEVVTVIKSSYGWDYLNEFFPFYARHTTSRHNKIIFNREGEGVSETKINDKLERYRLSHPYVEKTPVERLKSLKERVGTSVHGEIDGIIAAMEKA